MDTIDRIFDTARTMENFTVAELAEQVGMNETTIRKYVKANSSFFIAGEGRGRYNYGPNVVDADREPGDLVEDEDQPEDAQIAEPEIAVTDTPAKKKYIRHIGENRTQTTRLNQITKAEIGVRRTADHPDIAATHGIENKWFAICITHGNAISTNRVVDAHWFSSYPDFCPTCRPLLEGKIGRRRTSMEKVPVGIKFSLNK